MESSDHDHQDYSYYPTLQYEDAMLREIEDPIQQHYKLNKNMRSSLAFHNKLEQDYIKDPTRIGWNICRCDGHLK